MYYLFINEQRIDPYNGEILKRYVGNKLVKAISNPTDEDLKEFRYMELVKSEVPEYEEETQYLEYSYYVENDKIYKKCEVKDIVIDDIYTTITIFMPQITVQRKDIQVISNRETVYIKIKATNLLDFKTNTYTINMIDLEEK